MCFCFACVSFYFILSYLVSYLSFGDIVSFETRKRGTGLDTVGREQGKLKRGRLREYMEYIIF